MNMINILRVDRGVRKGELFIIAKRVLPKSNGTAASPTFHSNAMTTIDKADGKTMENADNPGNQVS